jgi:hypothetical protein
VIEGTPKVDQYRMALLDCGRNRSECLPSACPSGAHKNAPKPKSYREAIFNVSADGFSQFQPNVFLHSDAQHLPE